MNNCAMCSVNEGKVRKNLGVNVGPEMLKSINIIQNRLDCATQAMSPAAIPSNIDQNTISVFIRSAIEAVADYRLMQSDWWNTVKKEFNFADDVEVYIDLGSGEFYIFEKCSN